MFSVLPHLTYCKCVAMPLVHKVRKISGSTVVAQRQLPFTASQQAATCQQAIHSLGSICF